MCTEVPDTIRFLCTAKDANLRLDVFLAARISGCSRERLQKLIAQQHVTVNEKPSRKSRALAAGDRVAVRLPAVVTPTAPVPENIPLNILYEDSDLIVINKPAGLVVHPAPGHGGGTLVNALLHHCGDLGGIGGERRPGIVHRLDKDTSGVLVVAKNDASMLALGRQFRQREVRKDYQVVVRGIPVPPAGRIEASLARHPRDRQRFAVTRQGGRVAVTFYDVVESWGRASLLHVQIVTGRTHQIRVHLAWLGHPVLGDPRYGGRGRLPDGTLIPRQMLHARRLCFRHPAHGLPLDVTARTPPDMQAVLEALRNNPSSCRS